MPYLYQTNCFEKLFAGMAYVPAVSFEIKKLRGMAYVPAIRLTALKTIGRYGIRFCRYGIL